MILLAYISENHYNKEDQFIRQIFFGYSRKRRGSSPMEISE
ncbi:hypothetical protein CLCHR_42390 [Clostridium chromiireducens]|uniref:Uncharacterized protein n=1 Tax=Clostridium chromiireducens TaxID=225345 RepID=A0A1V4IE14_9CLOT|nr:hypothetical protein CLCHR_42390 [Clostridium chromiireducens]